MREEVNLFGSLAARLLHFSRGANDSRRAFKSYIIITYQSTKASYIRKVVDAREPPLHIWKVDKARYLELVTDPGSHYKTCIELRRKPET